MADLLPILTMFGTTVLQNASFTLISRARNGSNIAFHAVAAVISSVVWLVVIRQVVQHLDSTSLLATYVVGSVTGSVAMHWASMRFIERRLLAHGGTNV